MPIHRSRAGASQSSQRRKASAKDGRNAKTTSTGAAESSPQGLAKNGSHGKPGRATLSIPVRAHPPFTQDPLVLEAAYRAFERLSQPRYLH